MQIIFTQSGDSLSFDPTNHVLLEYFVNQCQSTSHLKCYQSNEVFNKLRKCIANVAQIFEDRLKDSTFTRYIDSDFSQSMLNRLHHDWVKYQLSNQKISLLLEKIDPNLLEQFRYINDGCHELEGKHWYFRDYDVHPTQYKNPYGTDCLDFNRYNISMEFNNLGRPSYNKWHVYDDNIYDTDTNDFTELSGSICILLTRPETRLPPVEYTDWCKHNELQPIGTTLGIGNFINDYDTVSSIFYRNIENESNRIIFEL